jgi:hypothetical protein
MMATGKRGRTMGIGDGVSSASGFPFLFLSIVFPFT